ncbi:MAG: orotate phosphoribosyltransferase [Armatimonadota bacterium]
MAWAEEKEALGKRIVEALYERGLIRTWYRDKPEGWTLVSGAWSPLYIQLRPVCSHPELLRDVGEGLGRLIREEAPDVTKIVGVAMAGIPLAVAASLSSGLPCLYTRKLEGVRSAEELTEAIQQYGEHAMVEGDLAAGDRLVALDDLVTGFDSKLIAVRQVEHEMGRLGLQDVVCRDVAVVLDREQGASQTAEEHDIRLHALVPFATKGLDWLADAMAPLERDTIRSYLTDPDSYQSSEKQAELAQAAG